VTRVRAFFLEEATACLATLTDASASDAAGVRALHDAARRLRGNAQVARYREVTDVVRPLEQRLKRVLMGLERWTPEAAEWVAVEAAAVARVIDEVREGRIERETRMEDAMEDSHDTAEAETAIEELEYRGQAALERAAQLHEPLVDAIVSDEAAGPLLDELFDLIRLGME
jgi:chemotaxis protein histidine kinase CheA